MDDTTVSTLNDLLKGEEMAINSYAKFIQETTDETLKNKFKEIQKEHNEHAKLISERILDLSGTPKQGTGMAGVMADVKYAFESMTRRSNHEILKDAWHGEDQGVAMSEKIADDKLDEESKKLIHHIVQHDHEHIKSLEKLLDQHRMQ
jgi:bacterioferritin (cytochrome b1)